MRTARIFPRKTNATPDDEHAYVGRVPEGYDHYDISVTFSWDIQAAERLAEKCPGKVSLGGPAFGSPGGDFEPGKYLKKGYVITSRGCPNQCWFCDVHKREGDIRELPITEGWDILDSNLLACSDHHVWKVFNMLSRQPKKARFTGGLDTKILKQWHVDGLRKLKPYCVYVAYDTPDDLEPLVEAGRKFVLAGFTKASHKLRCYVLCGHHGDTIENAEKRMKETWAAGFLPMAMVYRDRNYQDWAGFQRSFSRPAITAGLLKG